MNRIKHYLTILVVAGALTLSTSPANAGELRLTKREANHMTQVLLNGYVGPAVSDTGQVSPARAWNCTASGRHGYCNGSIKAGNVVCKGRFHVKKKRQGGQVGYAVWPVRMTCAD